MRPTRTEIGVQERDPQSVQREVDQVRGDDRRGDSAREQNGPEIGRLEREAAYEATSRGGPLTRPLT